MRIRLGRAVVYPDESSEQHLPLTVLVRLVGHRVYHSGAECVVDMRNISLCHRVGDVNLAFDEAIGNRIRPPNLNDFRRKGRAGQLAACLARPDTDERPGLASKIAIVPPRNRVDRRDRQEEDAEHSDEDEQPPVSTRRVSLAESSIGRIATSLRYWEILAGW